MNDSMERLVSKALEERIQTIGQTMWAELQSRRDLHPRGWIDRLIAQLLGDEQFRLQGLRFIDTVPALTDDTQLVNHFTEYFSTIDVDHLPPLLAWGIRRSKKTPLPSLMAPMIRASVRRVAQRFIAAQEAEGILRSVSKLRSRGICASLDMLGEATVSEAEARDYQQAYLDLIAKAAESPELHADLNLSIKVSSLYSQISVIDFEGSVDQLAQRLRPICHAAMAAGITLTLDMEQYELKGIILALLKRLATEASLRQWDGLGIAVQAYLRDTDNDLDDLLAWIEARGVSVMVRLVRGAYWDMETVVAQQQGWPVPVWTCKDDTDACYERSLARLFQSPLIRPAVATHNLRSIACAMALAEETGRGRETYEFQMLHGMSVALEPLITSRDLTLRHYLPFGELLQGIAYLVRRLLENSSDQSILPMMPQLAIDQILKPPLVSSAEDAVVQSGFANLPLHRFTEQKERDGFKTALEDVESKLGNTYQLMLPGHMALEEQTIDSTNPADTSQLIGRVVTAGEDDLEIAIRQAQSALGAWREKGLCERASDLDRIADALSGRRDWFAAWEVKEAGKGWAEADADVAEAIDFLRYYAERARILARGHNSSVQGEDNRLSYHPLGLGVVLPPWNFPLAIPVGMLAAAIVCGNCVILKPASQTPVVAWHFCQLLEQLGLPDGVVTCLPGSGSEIGETLVRDRRVHFVAFTGSRSVGLHLHHLLSQVEKGQQHIKRLIAEMGGKNAIIIDADADLDDAVSGVIESAFGYQGQKCSACSRVICVDLIHDRFVNRLTEATRSLRMGNPVDPANRVGPVISTEARQRIQQYIDEAGFSAKLLYHGVVDGYPGHYIGPAIFIDVDEGSPLAQEEIFGPVLTILRAQNFNRALSIANSTAYALTGGIYSRLPSHLAQARREFEVGNLYINRKITRAMVNRQPFGGFKLSGMGFKAGGPDYLLQFLHSRTTTENRLRRGFAPVNINTRDHT
jgi:RHH-type proline utilization regulon transcriptional repressor/proline dehydrogenase/delta 1-pyrroline-5-carboxylate dehydrogenase